MGCGIAAVACNEVAVVARGPGGRFAGFRSVPCAVSHGSSPVRRRAAQ